MLKTVRVELAEANAFVQEHHRHHKPVRGHRFSVGVSADGVLVGVAICGRPVARSTDPKTVLEVLRVCTVGTPNACSFLYGKVARIAAELGFSKIQTFVLDSESGQSCQAAGYVRGHTTRGGSWGNRPGRRNDQPEVPKTLWYRDLCHG